MKLPDDAALADAVEALLRAGGLDPTRADLFETPRRVAELWVREFLDGYQLDPAQVLLPSTECTTGADAVFVFDLAFHAMCPHHLVPYYGNAHVAYLPNGRIIGLGRIAQLVRCFTHRLTLQEHATRQIVDALLHHLGALGAGCVLEATHLCLGIPNDQHANNRVVSSAFVGAFEQRSDLRQRLLGAPHAR